MGVKRLAVNAGISISKAQEFWNKFFATYRGAHMWMEEVKRFVRKHGYVVNAFGRVRHLYHIFSDNPEVKAEAERQAINTIVQSSTSDFVLYSLQRVYKALKDFNGYIIMTIHDSGIVECKDEQVDDFIPIMEKCMTEPVFHVNAPMRVDIAVGKRWGSLNELER